MSITSLPFSSSIFPSFPFSDSIFPDPITLSCLREFAIEPASAKPILLKLMNHNGKDPLNSYPYNVLIDKDNNITIEFAVVDRAKENLRVYTTDINKLHVEIAKSDKALKEGTVYVCHRISTKAVNAVFEINDKLMDIDNISTRLADGLFIINIPALAKVEPPVRNIDIN